MEVLRLPSPENWDVGSPGLVAAKPPGQGQKVQPLSWDCDLEIKDPFMYGIYRDHTKQI
jgi:hypothetical protein